jgi:hypothetical protein
VRMFGEVKLSPMMNSITRLSSLWPRGRATLETAV